MENNNLYDRYSQLLESNFSLAKREREATRQQSILQAEKTANDNLSQEYIRREQAKRQLPQQAAVLGIGGASETAAMELDATYGRSRDSIYNSKQDAINQINLKTDKENSEELLAYQRALLEWEQERNQANRERERYEKELSFKREQFEYQKQQDLYDREKDAYERRQKELLNAQKALRSGQSVKKVTTTKANANALPRLYEDEYINGRRVLGRLF